MEKKNKLIAEFMGLIKYSEQHDGMYCVETMELDDFPILFKDGSYDLSWDWLMPVVQKIESLGYVFIIQGGKAEYGEMISETRCFIAEDKLSSTYKAVVEFIKENNNEKEQ